MAPSHHLSGPRVIHASTVRSVNRVSSLSLILSNPVNRIPLQVSPFCGSSTTRCFGWESYSKKHYNGKAKNIRSLEAHQRIVKYRSGKGLQGLQQAISWARGLPAIQYRHGQGWRLSSSWGKHNGKWPESTQLPKDNSQEEADRESDWRYEYEQRKEEIASRYEALKKKVEEDPYGMLFGNRYTRGVWDPYMIYDSLVSRRSQKQQEDGTQSSKQQTNRHEEKSSTNNPKDSATESKQGDIKISNEGRSDGAPATSFNMPYQSFSEEYDIDPITSRKVPRKKSPSTSDTSIGVNKSFDIPMKKFVEAVSKLHKPPNPSNDAQTTTKVSDLVDKVVYKGNTDSATSQEVHPMRPWLDREGFGTSSKPAFEPKSTSDEVRKGFSTDAEKKPPKIESSLDRHVRNLDETESNSVPQKRLLEYKGEENKTEDIDLLRVSDVRAVSGRTKKPTKEPEEMKQQRRRELEMGFEGNAQKSAEIDNHLIKTTTQKKRLSEADIDMPRSKRRPDSINPTIPEASFMNKITAFEPPATRVDSWGYDVTPIDHQNSIKEIEKEVQAMENIFASREQSAGMIQGNNLHGLRESILKHQQKLDQLNKYWRKAASEAALADEVKTQKAAMDAIENHGRDTLDARDVMPAEDPSLSHRGEGDMSANVHEFAKRDRWYKRKSPHATLEELRLKAQREEQQAKDQALVREVRNIYEDTYGVIDENHRQNTSHPRMQDKEDPSVQKGLEDYERAQGKQSYSFKSGEDPMKDDSMAETQNSVRMPTPVKEIEPDTPTSSALKASQSPLTEKLQIPTPPASEAASSESAIQRPKKITYKILALDNDAHEVVTANTTSSIYETSSFPRSASTILSHLSAPAKFIPHIEALEGTDYELVAGNRQTLVYKKIEEAEAIVPKTAPINTAHQSSVPNVKDSGSNAAKAMTSTLPSAEEPTTYAKSESNGTSRSMDSTPGMSKGEIVIDHETSNKTPAIAEQDSRQQAKSSRDCKPAYNLANPIDGTIGRYASPTGFVNHDLLLPRTKTTENPSTGAESQSTKQSISDKVRREEDLFSGSPRNHWSEEDADPFPSGKSWVKDKSCKTPRTRKDREISKSNRFWKTLKHMFLAGSFAAVFSYAVGVFSELKKEKELKLIREKEMERQKEEEEKKRKGLGLGLGFWDWK